MSVTRSIFSITAILGLFILSGCGAGLDDVRIEQGTVVELGETPFYPQEMYQCGPASLAMLLGASEVTIDPDILASQVYLPGRKGSLQLELISTGRQYGRIPYIIDSQLSALISELGAGRPVLVLQNLGLNIFPVYHYAVVIGALPPDKLVLRSGTTRRLVVDADHFLASWRRAGSWGMVVLNPGELPEAPDPVRYLEAVSSFEISGNIPEAELAYRAACSAWPGNQTARVALGNNYLRQARYQEAALIFRELLAINPNHVAASNNLAEALVKRGCYEQALAVINRTVTIAEELNSPLTKTVLETQLEISEQVKALQSGQQGRCTELQ